MSDDHVQLAIIGAGFAGIGLAINLQRRGIEDFAILERADAIGGTWRDNTYPGCACDVASSLYSYSFAPNPDWKRAYGNQPEILAYLQAVAGEHDVERFVRFGTEVTNARWDDDRRVWALETSKGPITANALVSAVGPFGAPILPEVPGLDDFQGPKFHSLDWDHDHDLTGERVAVIGTGASAVQFIPKIQPKVGRLTVFQRTPPWIIPRFDRRTSAFERALFRRVPALQRAIRGVIYASIESLGLVILVDRRFRHVFEALGKWQLRRQVKDPDLRARLTPNYVIGCKRAILSDTYLPALTRDNVDVVTSAVTEVRERSVVAADGSEHEVDTIIFGTGFEVPSHGADNIVGRDGRSILEIYRERPQSYLGTTMAGFPNFFMMLGPFSGAGNQSALYTLESQMNYIVDAVQTMRREGASLVEVRPEMQARFTDEAERRSEDTVWLQGGCKSYYTTPDGKNAGLWPGFSFEFRRRTRRFDSDAYTLESANGDAVKQPAPAPAAARR